MPGNVTGFRGTTVLPVKWSVVQNESGDRFIEGIAYNAAIVGDRRRITCSDAVWHSPDEDVFYSDEAVRWTVSELQALKLSGTPMRFMHEGKLPAVGKVVENFVDHDGHLHIVAKLRGDTKYGRKAIEFVDSGECHELSVGYPLVRNHRTREVKRAGIDEVSLVPEAHFRGCKVSIKAGRSEVVQRVAPYTIFRAVRAGLTVETDSEDPAALLHEEEDIEPQGFQMSDPNMQQQQNSVPKNAAEMAANIGKDFGFAGPPPQLADQVEGLKRIMIEQTRQLSLISEENKRLKELEDKRKATAAEAAKKYAERQQPLASATLAAYKKAVAEEGVTDLTPGYEEVLMSMMTDNGDISKEHQAAQIACMRKMSKQDKELVVLRARNLELEAAQNALEQMTNVAEAERGERRELKAGRRMGGSIMEADDATETVERGLSDYPSWVQNFSSNNAHFGNGPRLLTDYAGVPEPSQRRIVSAQRSAPRPAAAPQAAAPQAKLTQVPQMQQRNVNAGRNAPAGNQMTRFTQRQGVPTLGKGNSMDELNPDLFAHAQEMRQYTSSSTGNLYHLAGRDLQAPLALQWGN